MKHTPQVKPQGRTAKGWRAAKSTVPIRIFSPVRGKGKARARKQAFRPPTH